MIAGHCLLSSCSFSLAVLPGAVTARTSTRWQSECCCDCKRSWRVWRGARCSPWAARSICSSNRPWTTKTSAGSSQAGRPGCRCHTRRGGYIVCMFIFTLKMKTIAEIKQSCKKQKQKKHLIFWVFALCTQAWPRVFRQVNKACCACCGLRWKTWENVRKKTRCVHIASPSLIWSLWWHSVVWRFF